MTQRFKREKANLAKTVVLRQALRSSTDKHSSFPSVSIANKENYASPIEIPNRALGDLRRHEPDFELEAEEDRQQAQRNGAVVVAEQGQFSPRQSRTPMRQWRSQIWLQVHRLALLRSPPFQPHSQRRGWTLDWLWTALDPTHADIKQTEEEENEEEDLENENETEQDKNCGAHRRRRQSKLKQCLFVQKQIEHVIKEQEQKKQANPQQSTATNPAARRRSERLRKKAETMSVKTIRERPQKKFRKKLTTAL